MTTNYSPYRSTVTDETLVRFLQTEVEFNLCSVPGIGPKAKEVLSEKGVKNTFQLIAQFMRMKNEDGNDCVQHCTAFFNWLQEVGVKSNRHNITKSIAEKVSISFPSLYVESQFEAMDSEV